MHASQNVTNLLPFSTLEGSRCRLIPVLSGLQECNYVTLQYKQVMTRAQPPLLDNLLEISCSGEHPENDFRAQEPIQTSSSTCLCSFIENVGRGEGGSWFDVEVLTS